MHTKKSHLWSQLAIGHITPPAEIKEFVETEVYRYNILTKITENPTLRIVVNVAKEYRPRNQNLFVISNHFPFLDLSSMGMGSYLPNF
jgi:hypothetical protein